MGRIRDISLTAVLCLAGLALSVLLFGPQIIRTFTGANDFVGFYTAGELATSRNLYDVQGFMHQQGVSTGFISDQILFVRLPWQALLFAPLTVLPFATAHVVWAGLGVLGVLFFLACFPAVPRIARAVVICWSIPVFIALDVGQDIPLVIAALGAGFYLLGRDRPFAAGMCFALGLAKPHLLWPLAMVFLWHRMWRVCAGGAMGCAALTAVSFLTGGPDWIPRCLNVMRYADLHARLVMMPTLHSALLGVPHGDLIEATLTLVILGAILSGRTWQSGATMALVAGVLLGRHAFMGDCALILPALFLMWKDFQVRTALLVLASPLVYVPGILLGLPWLVAFLIVGITGVALLTRPILVKGRTTFQPAV